MADIRRVTNSTDFNIHVMLLSEHIDKSYDLFLAPGQSVQYDHLFLGARAPVPEASNQTAFDKNRIRLQVGSKTYAIYTLSGTTRLVDGDSFNPSAPPIEPWPGKGTIDLSIEAVGPRGVQVSERVPQPLDENCGPSFAVRGDWVYFQGGPSRERLYKRKIDGTGDATKLDDHCAQLAVPGDGWVYFVGGAGLSGLYRIHEDGTSIVQMSAGCTWFTIHGDYLYYYNSGEGLRRNKRDGNRETQERLDPNCGGLIVPGNGYIYFLGGPQRRALYRVPEAGGIAVRLADRCTEWFIVAEDGYCYFVGDRGWNPGIWRIPAITGKVGDATKFWSDGGPLVAPGDGYIYFRYGDPVYNYSTPLCRLRMWGSGSGYLEQYDPYCGQLKVPGDGYIYFTGNPSHTNLYRIAKQGVSPLQPLIESCAAFIFAGGFIYYQGGTYRHALYRVAMP